MWLWLRGGCTVCDMQAAQVQGRLGLPEMQAVPGLCAGEPLPEGQLLRHQRCHLRGLLARVSRSFFPNLITVSSQTCMHVGTNPQSGASQAFHLRVHHWIDCVCPVLCPGRGTSCEHVSL